MTIASKWEKLEKRRLHLSTFLYMRCVIFEMGILGEIIVLEGVSGLPTYPYSYQWISFSWHNLYISNTIVYWKRNKKVFSFSSFLLYSTLWHNVGLRSSTFWWLIFFYVLKLWYLISSRINESNCVA